MGALYRLRAEQSERIAAWIRLAALAGVIPLVAALILERGDGARPFELLQFGLMGLGLLYSAAILLLIGRGQFQTWMPNFSVAADGAGLTLSLAAGAWMGSPYYLHSSAAILLFAVYVAAVSTRLSTQLTLAAALWSALSYTALWAFYYPEIRAAPGAAILPAIQVSSFLLRSFYILAAGLLCYLTVRFVNIMALDTVEATAEKQRLEAERSLLSRFLQPELVEKLVSGDMRAVSEGRRLELCIGFVDIRGFTALCERMPPEMLQPFMNRYFSAITEEILGRGGTLDKYLGDGVMFFFGAPISQQDDADRAMQTACGIDRALLEFNQENAMIGLPEIEYGIGLHSDVVIVGAFGSPERIDYTAFGDGVNVASRIEKASRDGNRRILLSDRVRRRLRQDYSIQSIGFVQLPGKSESMELFAPQLDSMPD